MLMKPNPDPNVEPITVAMYHGLKQSAKGTLRTRYDILVELKAPESIQREMQNLISFLVLNGIVLGLIFGIAVGLIISNTVI